MQQPTKKDFITIGIIARNEAKHIRTTLQFLVTQTYGKEHFEIIIADGNSSDGTRDVAGTFLAAAHVSYKIINEKEYENKR